MLFYGTRVILGLGYCVVNLHPAVHADIRLVLQHALAFFLLVRGQVDDPPSTNLIENFFSNPPSSVRQKSGIPGDVELIDRRQQPDVPCRDKLL